MNVTFSSFSLRSILTITIIFLGIIAIYVISAEIYDGAERLGNYEWNEPPVLVAIILFSLYIVSLVLYGWVIKPWIDRRKKAAADSEKLRDFS